MGATARRSESGRDNTLFSLCSASPPNASRAFSLPWPVVRGDRGFVNNVFYDCSVVRRRMLSWNGTVMKERALASGKRPIRRVVMAACSRREVFPDWAGALRNGAASDLSGCADPCDRSSDSASDGPRGGRIVRADYETGGGDGESSRESKKQEKTQAALAHLPAHKGARG